MNIWDINSAAAWRDALRVLIEKIDNSSSKDDKARILFLTYQLDMPLFEEHVLGEILTGTSGSLRSASRCLAINKHLKEMSALVLYDRNGLIKARQRRTCIAAAPINMRTENAVFHPKIVLYARGDDVGMMIGSANLTRSGLGSNREGLILLGRDENGDCIVRGQGIRVELANFLKVIKKYINSELSDIHQQMKDWINLLERSYTDRSARGWAGLQLLWSTPDEPEKGFGDFFNLLERATDFIALAPYFPIKTDTDTETIPKVLDHLVKLKNNDESKVWLCPALAWDSCKRHIGHKVIDKLKKLFGPDILRRYTLFETKDNRFAHAKIIRFESGGNTYLVVGSHNITSAAWGGSNDKTFNPRNIEASVLINCNSGNDSKTGPYGEFTKIDSDNFKKLSENFEEDADNEDDLTGSDIMPEIEVIADWNDNSAKIIFTPTRIAPEGSAWQITTPWCRPGKDGKNTQFLHIAPGEKWFVERDLDLLPLVTHTTYRLKRLGDVGAGKQHEWYGVVCENNMQNRPGAAWNLDSYWDCLLSNKEFPDDNTDDIPDDDNPEPPKPPKPKGYSKNGTIVPQPDCSTLDNWYDLFRGIRVLKEKTQADYRHLVEAISVFVRELIPYGASQVLGGQLLIRYWLIANGLNSIRDYRKQGIETSLMFAKFDRLLASLRKQVSIQCGSSILDWAVLIQQEAIKIDRLTHKEDLYE